MTGSAQSNLIATVRHAPSLNGTGRIEGSAQQLLGESVTLNSGFVLTGDLIVPGTPNIITNGSPSLAGVIVGTGSTTPSGYYVTLNGGVSLRYLRTRSNAVSLPTVTAPPSPAGTRSVNINSAGQSIGDPATLRNLTLNGNVGQYAVPPGTYGTFMANGGSGFTLGVAGATNPSTYNLQSLTLNGSTRLDIAGPIILKVANGFTGNGLMGTTNQSSWLQLQLSSGGFTLNSGCTVHGSVVAPAGTVIINGSSYLFGSVKSDRLTVNSGGIIKGDSAAVNQPPVANAQGVNVTEDTAQSITLTGTDPEGSPLGYTVLTQPTRGSLTGTAPNLTYTPGPDENGTDSFTFKVNDGAQDSATATVSITIAPINDAPVALAQSVGTAEDTPASITLVGTDVEGSPLAYTIVTQPAHGILINPAPGLLYVPDPNYYGSDSFAFRVNDGALDSAVATVSITVSPLNDRPVADAQSLSINEDTALPVTLTGTDIENDPLTFTVLAPPAHGTLSGTPPNLSYLPATNFHGGDSFTFEVGDGTTNSLPATISLAVQPINDRPIAYATNYITLEDTATNVVITATDIEDTNLTYTVVTQPAHGTVTGAGTDLVYSPAADFNGTDSFTFRASDGTLDSDTVTVTLTVTAVNDTPIADAKAITTDEDIAVPITLTATDVDGDELTYTIATSPTHGTLSGALPNLTYTPDSNYRGTDTFTYVASDAATNSEPATVTITINPVNDVPLVDAGLDQLVNVGTTVSLNGLATDDGDAPGAALVSSWTQVSGPGTAVFANASAPLTTVTFSHAGIYVLRLSSSDSQLSGSDEVVISINAAPVVSAGPNQTIFIHGQVQLQGSVTDDGLPPNVNVSAQWSVVSGPGVMAIDNPYSATTTAGFSMVGTYVLRLTGNDSMLSSSSDVTITVRPVNHPPEVYAGTNQLILFPATAGLAGIVTDDGEPQGGAVTVAWSKVTGPGTVTFASATSLNTTATFGQSGTYVLALVATDTELSATNYVTIVANGAPVVDAGADQITTVSNLITLPGAVTDDGLPSGVTNVAWVKVSGPGQALFTQPASAVTGVRFTAAGNYLLRLSATDSHAVGQDEVVVTVRVAGENMPPFVTAGTNQYVALTNRTVLQGIASDDGLPDNSTLSISWSVISGPGSVVFDATNNPASAATFSAAGEYVLRLTVSDTEFTVSDEVAISVYPGNQPPVVDAGADQSIVTGPATLGGTISDDGLPTGGGLTSSWSKVSGPGSVTFGNSNSLVTTVSFSEAGVYLLRLSASDSQFSRFDEVTVTVTGNQPPIVDAGADQVLDLVTASGAAFSTVTYPANPDAWRTEPSQPGLTGVWGNIGSATRVECHSLSWSGSDLYVGGGFQFANGVEVRNLARWNGCTYSALYDPRPRIPSNPSSTPIGYISSGSSVFPVAARGGEVFVSGGFLGTDLNNDGHSDFLARWSGAGWEAWQPRLVNSYVTRDVMLTTSNATYFGGQFRFQPGSNSVNSTALLPGVPVSFNVAKWDGTNWIALGEGIRGINSGTNWSDANTAWVRTLAVAPNGDVFAGGQFVMETPSGFATNLARWNGTNWSPVGVTLTGCGGFACSPEILALTIAPNGDLIAGGNFTQAGPLAVNYVARWDGTNWSALGAGASFQNVKALAYRGNDLYMGGDFTQVGSLTVNRFARWNGTNWFSISNGMNSAVAALAVTPNGIYAGGEFSTAGGQTANRIAKWGGRELPTLNGPSPITVANSPAIGTLVPVTVSVSHPCGSAMTLTWNVDGGAAEEITSVPAISNAAPQSISFTNLYTPGVHTLVATLDDGVSGPVIFSTTVTVLTPAMTTLAGTITDDGLPSNTLIGTWDLFTGPASVTFSQPSTTNAQPVTDASFTAVGTYVLRLTGSDTELSATDTLTINVRAAGNTNLPPTVNAGPDQFIAIDESAALNGVALDDGLPTNSLSIAWSQVSGPGTTTFAPAANLATVAATFSAAGTYVLRLSVSDSDLSSFDEVTVTVSGITNTPPLVNAGVDQTIGLADSAALSGTVTDDGLPFGILNSAWSQQSGSGVAIFRVQNGITYAQFSDVGTYVLRLNANDGRLNGFDDVAITVLSNTPGPVVQLLSPLDSAIITSPTVVTGSVSSAILQNWTLQYRLKPSEDEELNSPQSPALNWTALATATTEANAAPLATFDPTLLLNGIYELQLTATDQVGRTVSTEPVTLVVDRNMKVGHFTLSFNDLTIPVAGIPIQVTRTYDSRDKRVGDFGVGWTLDLKNIRLQKNRHLGRAWDQSSTGGTLPSYCIDTLKPRVVTITFPDGRVQKFQASPVNPNTGLTCQALIPLVYPTMIFVPVGGNTFGTLTPLSELDGEIVVDEQLVFGAFEGIPGRGDFISYERLLNPPPGPADNILFNPDLFEFTSQEGYRYILSETNGLRSVTDPNGNTLTITTNGITWTNATTGGTGLSVAFQRDGLGRITNIVDALGHAMTYNYDTNGNLITFTDRAGNTNGFTYDGRHSLLTLSDGRDVETISNEYDADGRLLRNTDALGNSVGYSYDLNNQRTYTTNRLGFVTLNEFDSHGNVIRTVNPLGAVSSFVYDANDNLLVKSNANGCACAVAYTYDAYDNRISETDARGNTTTFTYNGQRKVLTMTEPSGFATTNTYDSNGNLASTLDSAGQTSTFAYDASGKVVMMTDPKGNTAQFAYNSSGFLTNEVNALGHVTEYTVDANGNQLSQALVWSRVSATQASRAERNSKGWLEASLTPTPITVVAGTNVTRIVMRHEYDTMGRPLRAIYYDSSSSGTAYNKIGKKEHTTNQLGNVTSYQYDDQGRMATITHPNGCQESFQYDAEGQLIRSTDRRGQETRFSYDPTGKLINTVFADGSQISASYFADGSLRTETAKNGEVTLYEIDADGNRTSVSNSVGITQYTYNYKKFATSKVDPMGRTSAYDYDVLGRNTLIVYPNGSTKTASFSGRLVTSETDQNGRTTGYGYDALGRLVSVTNAAGENTRYTYDEPGNKTAETDPLGRTTFYEYDSMRRLTRTVYPDASTVATEYDAGGRVIARTDQDGFITHFSYDVSDNVTNVVDALGGVTSFSYDCGGNKVTQIDPDGRSTSFEYDTLSRLTRVSHSCGTSETTVYDIAGRAVAKTDANGQTTQFGYDLRNNLVSVIDPLNRSSSFIYDAAGNRLSETDTGGQTTSYLYDSVERRTRTTHPDGTIELFSYDGTGRFLTHTDQQGKVTTFANDPVGRLVSVTDPLGRVTRYGYDANGNRVAETNANNLVTRHQYDEMGRRTLTTYPDSSTMTVAYDRLGRRVSETDAVGHSTLLGFDALSRLVSRRDHLGNVTAYGYDAVGRLTSQTDANNQTTTFGYDCLGRRNRIVNPDGSAQSVVFDLVGRRLSETDANTNSTFFTYDVFGRLLATTNALGHVTQFGYDALDRLVSRTDALGRTTTFGYDALGRRISTTYPDGAVQTAGYDAKGRRIRETDPAGNSTFYVYDDSDRLTAVTNALNQVTLYQYDAAGRLIAETDALGRTTTFEYDALDRRTRTVLADGTARTTTYDVLGRRVSDADQADVATTYGYDAIGRLTAVTNALGDPTFYGYDALGRLVAQTNANGQVTTFAYDFLGRRVRRSLPGGQTETYGYDPVGNLVVRTNFNGRVIGYTYDPLNRVTAKVPDATLLTAGSVPVTYSYNALGLRTNMTDAGGTTHYAYDVRDRLAAKSVQWTLLPTPTTLSYAYDTNGNLAAIQSSNPNGTDVTYTNDALNRLSIVHEGRLGPTTYTYDPVGNLQGFTRPNGVQSQMQYDSLYRLTNLGVTRASAPVARYEYTVGAAGHRLGSAETIRTNSVDHTIYRSFGYDAAYRLTTEVVQLGASATPGLVTYTYDAAGNRLSRTSTLGAAVPNAAHAYDSNNRLLSDRYDANGNTTNAFVTTPLTGQTNEVFDRFDFEDRLFERTTTLNAQAATITVLHDGDGNRVAKTVVTGTNTLATLYVVDDRNPTGYAQVLEELTSANGEGFAVTRVYTWGHALLSQDAFAGGQWTPSFHGHDGQGSVRFLTDTNGVVTDTFDYDAFGNLIARSGSTQNLYLHRGEQFDPDLNLYYLRARYHNPATGRFWTQDSFEGFATDPASLHHYTFNQNDPVNRIDPSGHISLAETINVAALAPIVRSAFLSMWDGVNNFSHGVAGGNALKFTSRQESFFIDSLAAGPGWKFGKPNFWATAKGAPFLLVQNPNIWQGRKPCFYDCVPFDQDVPVYGPGAQHPLFEFEESPIYGLAEKIGYYGTAPVRFLGGAGVAAGVAGKGIADLLVNTGGAVAYGMAANVYGPETAAKFFGAQADATAALATGLGRLGIAAATLGYQPLLNVVAPEFAAEQRALLQNTATAAFKGFTGGDDEFAGLGWEFRAGFTAFNLLGVIQAAGELTQVAKAARLSARAIAAESAGQMGAVRALRINQPTAEAAEAAAALTGAPQTTCRAGRPEPALGLVDGPDGIPVPVTELKNSKFLPITARGEVKIGRALEPQKEGPAADFENSLPGTASDVASKKRIVPTLDFDNPNPRGRSFVKFDGQDFQDPNTFIDRKFNATTRPKQVADIQRVAEALRQNPTASLVIEVPNAAAQRAVQRLLTKAGQASNPQITVRIAQ